MYYLVSPRQHLAIFDCSFQSFICSHIVAAIVVRSNEYVLAHSNGSVNVPRIHRTNLRRLPLSFCSFVFKPQRFYDSISPSFIKLFAFNSFHFGMKQAIVCSVTASPRDSILPSSFLLQTIVRIGLFGDSISPSWFMD